MKRLICMIIICVLCLSVFSGCNKTDEHQGADAPTQTVVRTVEGNMKTYYEMSDGSWQYDGHTYQYRLEITGRQPSAVKDSTYVYLSNVAEISFSKAMMASGLSSNTEDYFDIEEAVLVELY